MKQIKWFINILAGSGLIALATFAGRAGNTVSETTDTGPDAVIEAVSLPSLSYKVGAQKDSVLLPLAESEYSKDFSELKRFFDGLDSLQVGKDTVLTIVHLGDSHIQAGYYSGKVMRLFHERFGNAGRGWVAPLKLSKTNEPDDYFISSAAKEWVAGRTIQHVKKCPVGIGGIGIQSVSPSINLDLIIAPNNGAGYDFNRAILYRGGKSMPMLPAGASKGLVDAHLAGGSGEMDVVADTFYLSRLTDTLQLHSTRRKQGTDQLLPASSFKNVYYGFNLTNGNPGILYHSIGVNGAMFINYTDENYIRQLALLKPSLLIVSLGTNETFGRRFNRDEFAGQVDAFVSLAKKYMPETAILLTTPPECYKRTYVNKKRTYVRNSNTQIAAKVIVDIARKDSVACWDLFAATGGKNSCTKWYKNGLMGRDRIHFSKEGYREQGTLLYRALMQTYNEEMKVGI